MPTTYNDQAYGVDIAFVSAGDALTTGPITLTDQDDDGLIEPGDTINGFTITFAYVGDTVVVDGVLITGVTFITTGGPFFTPTDGTVLQDGIAGATTIVFTSTSIRDTDLGPPCFVQGTLVLTPFGSLPVEDLKAGDQVMTRDNGARRLEWVGSGTMKGTDAFAPVRIDTGVLGNSEPIEVSQQHRILLTSPMAEVNFGSHEILVAAKHLVGTKGISLCERKRVTYVHIMFDQHEIICASGLWSESFFYGAQDVYGLGADSQRELECIFANNTSLEERFSETARYCLSGNEAKLVPAFLH